MAKPRQNDSLRTWILVTLPLLSLIGGFGTWALAGSNGTFDAITALLSKPGTQMPGTTADIIKVYTGIASLDSQLAILVTFFAPLVGDLTSESSASRLFSVYGIGQFGGAWCLMIMESLRTGNQGSSPIGFKFIGLVGIIFQNITYTVTIPLWLLTHILTSPVANPSPGKNANSALLVPTSDLSVLPASVVIGFLIPTILMGLPSPATVGPETHQYLIAFWQAFPVWTVLTHVVLQSLIGKTLSGESGKSRSQASLANAYLRSATNVYRSVLGFCMVTHIPAVLIALLPASVFSSSVPTLALLGTSTFSSVFIPYLPIPLDRQVNFTEGVHAFLLWDLYVGSLAFVLWAILLLRNATAEQATTDPKTASANAKQGSGKVDWTGLSAKIAMWCVVSGPIGAVTVLLWERDEILNQKIKQGE